MFGNLFGGIQGVQPNIPPGCAGSCELSTAASGAPIVNQALAVLAGVIGTYGFIEQIKLQRRMVALAERASDKADEFYNLSLTAYTTVSLPTWQKMRDLYDRYTTMWPMENNFINCAFSLREYCPDIMSEARAATDRVAKFFTHSNAQRTRQTGCAGAACHHTNYMAAVLALTKSSAASAALQYEEDYKRKLDRIYWERWQDGAKFVLAMGDRGVRAILAGAANVDAGLKGIGEAVAMFQQAAAGQAGAIANAAQFWGNIASGGFNGFGQAVGAGYFNSSPTASGWTTTVTPAVPAPSTSGYMSFK